MNKLIMAAIFVAGAFLLSMCSCAAKKENAQNAVPEKAAVTVETRTVLPQTLTDYIEFGGTVEALDSVAVLPSVAGKIAKILVETGDHVKLNQVIAQVDASKPGADFTMSPVRASIAGTITALPVSLGAFVTTSSTVAQISSTDRLEIKVNVSERFVPLVTLGQSAKVSFKSFPKESFAATVTKISPVLDPATRTMQVTLALSDDSGIIKAGMFAHVTLVTETKEHVLALPELAIVYKAGKPFVFLAEADGKGGSGAVARRLPVECGISVDGMTEITSGLEEGCAVIVKGQNMISDGQQVNAVSGE